MVVHFIEQSLDMLRKSVSTCIELCVHMAYSKSFISIDRGEKSQYKCPSLTLWLL